MMCDNLYYSGAYKIHVQVHFDIKEENRGMKCKKINNEIEEIKRQ